MKSIRPEFNEKEYACLKQEADELGVSLKQLVRNRALKIVTEDERHHHQGLCELHGTNPAGNGNPSGRRNLYYHQTFRWCSFYKLLQLYLNGQDHLCRINPAGCNDRNAAHQQNAQRRGTYPRRREHLKSKKRVTTLTK